MTDLSPRLKWQADALWLLRSFDIRGPGPLLTPAELHRMTVAFDRGDSPADFAGWIASKDGNFTAQLALVRAAEQAERQVRMAAKPRHAMEIVR